MLGTVIFACHKVESSLRSTSTNTTTNMQHQLSYNTANNSNYPHPTGTPYYDQPPYPPLTPAYHQGYFTHPPPPPAYSPSRWSQTPQNYHPTQPPSGHHQWSTPSPTHPVSPLPPSLAPSSSPMSSSHLRSATYSNSSAPGPPWQASAGGYEVYRGPSPGYAQYPHTSRINVTSNPNSSMISGTSSLSIEDVVPPPKRRVSPGSARVGDQYSTTASTGGRSGNRPNGVLECSSCGATASPEWRKGPSGKKELCNAYVFFFFSSFHFSYYIQIPQLMTVIFFNYDQLRPAVRPIAS